MAKFWREIREFLHSVPVPGVGVSIDQGKALVTAIKDDPGGTLIYRTPSPQGTETPGDDRIVPTDDAIGGVVIDTGLSKNQLVYYGLIALAVWAVLK